MVEIIAGRYQIVDELGKGGMGVVYRAIDRLNSMDVALKRVTVPDEQLDFASRYSSHSMNSKSDTADFRFALAREFKTLATLRHPNIISVLDYGFDDTRQPFFTMELLTGSYTIIEAGEDLPAVDQVELLVQLLQALAYLHRRGIIHRDLKPDNVIVLDGLVKVLDFGLAVAQDYRSEGGALAGTFAYMAPELLQGAQATEASDLYAVGLIAYELLSGSYPFDKENMHLLISSIIQDELDVDPIEADPQVKEMMRVLLQKDPARRQISAQNLIHMYATATEQLSRFETDLIRESFLQGAEFVGREAELAQLTGALEKINQPLSSFQGSAWLIGGESGVGKSRLVEEIRTQAMVSGAIVISGQAVTEGGAPYQMWRDVMRHLCLHTTLSDLEASVLKSLIPDIQQLLGREAEVPDAPELAPQDAQDRLFNMIVELFHRQEHPIMLLMEDLQWAAESLLPLQSLMHILIDSRLLIIGTYRSEEEPDLPKKLPEAQVIHLGRLNEAEISALTTSMLGGSEQSSKRVANFLATQTEGNAFFMIEVVRALAEQAGTLDQISKITLPKNVISGGMQSVIEQRLQHVPEWAQPLLEIAAVIGRNIDLEILKNIKPDMNIELWLRICDNSRILEFQDGEWRFSHHKIRETLRENLSEESRMTQNREVASAIERLYPDDEEYIALLAHHWAEAQDLNKEALYSEKAASLALTNGAATEAVRMLERALELYTQLDTDREHLAHIEQRLGEAYINLGLLDESITHSERALTLLKYRIPNSTLSLITLLLVQIAGQFWNRLTSRYTNMQTKTPKNAKELLTAGRACEQALQVYYFKNQRGLAFFAGIQGLNIMEAAGIEAQSEQARGYASIAMGMGALGQKRLATIYRNLADETAAKSLDMDARSWVLFIIGMDLSAQAEWEQAQHRFEMAAQFAQHLGHTRRWLETSSLLASTHFLRAQWETSGQLYHEMYETAVRHRDVQFQAWVLSAQGAQAGRIGKYEEALGDLQRCVPLYEETHDTGSLLRVYGLLAQVLTRMQKMDEAYVYVAKIEGEFTQSGSAFRIALADSYIGIAEYYLSRYEREGTTKNQQTAKFACEQLNKFAKNFASGRPIALAYQAWYDALSGDFDEAIQSAEKAITTAQELEMPYEEALTAYNMGRLFPEDHPHRATFVQQHQILFEQLGIQTET